MGWLIPKTHLRWREPYYLRRSREVLEIRALPRYFRPAAAVIVSLLLLAVWALAHLDPKKHPPSFEFALGLAVAFGPFMVYAVPLIYLLQPSMIRVTEAYISRRSSKYPVCWKYRDISSCRIITEGEGEGALAVLGINTRNGTRHFLGIDPSVSLDELCRVLEERGVVVTRAPAPTAEFPEAPAETVPPG